MHQYDDVQLLFFGTDERVILIHLGVDLGRIAKKEVSHSHSQMKITYLKLNPKVWSY